MTITDRMAAWRRERRVPRSVLRGPVISLAGVPATGGGDWPRRAGRSGIRVHDGGGAAAAADGFGCGQDPVLAKELQAGRGADVRGDLY